ncbi:hypothetical protein [Congregibacter litoralis]|uniref:Uncharacterized protein n=1 Tax=Congregibacter litoralis KT71 TaxID=314285 RepID=A4A882_9GAMM|nr:hypothetical protein [Congregibacter litoralis]EAQ97877.1 hypothetical protein KT71_14969 [Congregibacter litoralis KT71]
MARTRGEANRALYRARILLEAWERMRGDGRHSDAALIDAFLPASREQLRTAYGWFLLSLAGIEDSTRLPRPQSTDELPAPDPGKALSPEIAEFAQLEKGGWLAQMLADEVEASASFPHGGAAARGGLLVSDREPLGYPVVVTWADALAAIMARMDDSLSEC